MYTTPRQPQPSALAWLPSCSLCAKTAAPGIASPFPLLSTTATTSAVQLCVYSLLSLSKPFPSLSPPLLSALAPLLSHSFHTPFTPPVPKTRHGLGHASKRLPHGCLHHQMGAQHLTWNGSFQAFLPHPSHRHPPT
eukprot:356018-Chlamydomonas_euryale.AAC.4